MSKFSVGNHVRLTKLGDPCTDQVGVVESTHREKHWWAYQVRFGITHMPVAEHHLVLADSGRQPGGVVHPAPESPIVDSEMVKRMAEVKAAGEDFAALGGTGSHETSVDAPAGDYPKGGLLDDPYLGAPDLPPHVTHLIATELRRGKVLTEPDPVNAPAHYRSHPSGVECLTITRHMGFALGSAMKYIWRADLKGNAIQDLEKAIFYIQDEIDKRKAAA